MSEITRYRWNGTAFADITHLPATPLLAADSFLARDGGVVAFDEHVARFNRATDAQGMVFPSPAYIDAFAALIPREGEWFPRIDFTVRGEIECWMRPAPPLTTTVTLATADHDPRTEPAIKGPDLTILNSLRDHARERGADDAVILTPPDHEHPDQEHPGRIIDGATTCLVWWRDGVLTFPPASATRVDSVTARVLAQMAAEKGIPVNLNDGATPTDWPTPVELANTTVWAINALHGIRDVVAWIDGPTLAPNANLLAEWRSDYEQRRQVLSAHD
jgi:branched-subunit amino acid aminotransferase/4-amino-4-deoxychorismate lyase